MKWNATFLVLGALVILSTAVAAWWVMDPGTGSHLMDEATTSADASPAEDPDPGASAQPTGSNPEERLARVEEEQAKKESPPSGAQRLLHGTLIVMDPAGYEHLQENGSLSFLPLGHSSSMDYEATVVQGQWALSVPMESRLRLSSARIADRPTLVDQDRIFTLEDAPSQIVVQWIAPTLLHVVDARSGLELEGVDILKQSRWEDRTVHPSEGSLKGALVSGASSPVTLPGGHGRARLNVRAQGYAWRQVDIDFDQGAERSVGLTRGGRLEVSVGDHGLQRPAELRLYPGKWSGHDPAYLALPAKRNGTTVFSGLRAGNFQLRMEIGQWTDPPLELDRQEITIHAGETTRVVFDSTEMALSPEATLAGSLVLPGAATKMDLLLEISPAHGPALRDADHQRIALAEMRASSDGRTFAWNAGAVTCGRIRLAVHPLQYSVVVDLPTTGLSKVALQIEDLAQVKVGVIDARSQEPLLVSFLGWSQFEPGIRMQGEIKAGSDAERALPMESMTPDQNGQFAFSAPVGKIFLGVGLPGYSEEGRWVEVGPGDNLVSFELQPLASLVLGFLNQGHLVPAPSGLRVQAVDGDQRWELWDRVGARVLGIFQQPGRYLISASPDAEFTFSPQEVHIREGERTTVDIQVQRRQG